MTTLHVSFPASVNPAQVLAGLRGLLTSVGRPDRFGTGSQFVCIEVWANHSGITHLVTAPRSDTTIRVLSAALPGVRIEKVDRPTSQLSGVATGVRLSGPTPGIVRTDISSELSSALLASLSGLRTGEVVVLQWLMAPLGRSRVPFSIEKDPDRIVREKRSDTEVVAAGRVGAWTADSGRSNSLVFAAARVLRSIGGPSGGLRTRKSRRVVDAIRMMRGPTFVWPSHLNIGELAGMAGWPSEATPIRGLARGVSRLLPPPTGAPRTGPVVGVTTFPGAPFPIRLGEAGRVRHLHVVGPTGVGKTTLLTHLIEADVRSGRGVVVFDPLGDFSDRVCERIPASRRDDLVLVDPTETEFPVGLNVLAGPDRYRTTEFVVTVMARLFASSWGPRTADVLRASLLTLTTKDDATLADLPDLLTNPGFRRRYVSSVMDDRTLAGFWTWYEALSEAERSSVIAPVLNKVRAVVLRPEALRVLLEVVVRAIEIMLSMGLVDINVLNRVPVTPRRRTVNMSSRPSRMEPAASGKVRSSSEASRRALVRPWSGSGWLNASASRRPTLERSVLGR